MFVLEMQYCIVLADYVLC